MNSLAADPRSGLLEAACRTKASSASICARRPCRTASFLLPPMGSAGVRPTSFDSLNAHAAGHPGYGGRLAGGTLSPACVVGAWTRKSWTCLNCLPGRLYASGSGKHPRRGRTYRHVMRIWRRSSRRYASRALFARARGATSAAKPFISNAHHRRQRRARQVIGLNCSPTRLVPAPLSTRTYVQPLRRCVGIHPHKLFNDHADLLRARSFSPSCCGIRNNSRGMAIFNVNLSDWNL